MTELPVKAVSPDQPARTARPSGFGELLLRKRCPARRVTVYSASTAGQDVTVAILKQIWFWPNGGLRDRPWCDSPAEDAFTRTSRRVTERYSEALSASGIEAQRSALQVFLRESTDADPGVVLELGPHPAGDEVIRVIVPPGVAGLPPQDRALLVLDVVDRAMQRLAQTHGWPLEALARAHQHTVDHQLGFEMAGAWKTSPSRKRRVRPVARITDDGWSDLCFEVSDAKSRGSLGFTEAHKSPLNSMPKFKRSVGELRWADDVTIERPDDWQVRTGAEWGVIETFDISHPRSWPLLVKPAPPNSPMSIEVRER